MPINIENKNYIHINLEKNNYYLFIDDFYESLARFTQYAEFGFINKEGKEVIKTEYDCVGNFHEGLACFRSDKNDKYGYIDKTGKKVIKAKYNMVGNFNEGLAWFRKNDKYGYIDKIGKKLIKAKYDYAGDFHEGLAHFRKNYAHGFINKEGKKLIKAKYDYAGDFHEGLAHFKKNYAHGYINKEGKEVIEAKYENAGDFHEGLAWFRKNGKYGYINKEGKEVIEAKYDYAGDFHEGLAWFRKNGKYGYINKKGKEVIEAKYDYAKDFCDGLASVKIDGDFASGTHPICGFIDKTGNLYEMDKFDSASISDGMIIFDNVRLVNMKDLEKDFVCIITINGEKLKKEFKTMEQRDEYYNCLKAYIDGRTTRKEADINEMKRALKPLIEKLNEDILSIENKYTEDIVEEINESYKKHNQ